MEVRNSTLFLTGEVTRKSVPGLYKEWKKKSRTRLGEIAVIDLSGVSALDSAGVALISEIRDSQGRNLELRNVPEEAGPALELFYSPEKAEKRASSPKDEGFLAWMGGWMIEIRQALSGAFLLGVDLLSMGFTSLFSREGKRKGGFTEQAIEIGMNATPVVVLLALIVGVILTLQSAVQLKRFGGNMLVADLLAISLVREMGPILTSIVLAGRTGSAITSEIGAMKVGEELDAIKMMGLSPVKYLVLPKYYAMILSLPLLVVLADVIGIFSGMLISLMYLDLTPTIYIERVINVLEPIDIFHGFVKVPVFAWAIVTISSYFGLEVKGGASEVGKATTDSVVVSIFAVIVIDAVFSLFYLA